MDQPLSKHLNYLGIAQRYGLFSEAGCPGKDASIGFKAFNLLRHLYPDAQIYLVALLFTITMPVTTVLLNELKY